MNPSVIVARALSRPRPEGAGESTARFGAEFFCYPTDLAVLFQVLQRGGDPCSKAPPSEGEAGFLHEIPLDLSASYPSKSETPIRRNR